MSTASANPTAPATSAAPAATAPGAAAPAAAAATAAAAPTQASASASASATTILIVEDTPFWQKQIEQAIRGAGYATVMAGNGVEAIALLQTHKPAVIISDVEMPQMTGLELLKAVRAHPQWQKIPLILLTTAADRERIIEATRLRAAEYMLKGNFSAEQIVERVKKWLNPPKTAPAAPPAAPKSVASAFPRLLQRNEVIGGVLAQAAAPKSLANVVAHATQLCDGAKNDPNVLLEVIKNDPVFAMRVMQDANASKRVGSVEDAVRALGVPAIRAIAQSLGAFPSTSRSALATWQHATAVASVMHKIVPRSFEMGAGVAYLIGLLHDLPELMLRQAFPAQYEAALDFADQASKPLRKIMPDVLGVSMADLANELHALLKLPPLVAAPLREYAAADQEAGRCSPMLDRLAMALRCAEYYANALQLTSSRTEAMIAPFTQTECRAAYVAASPINGAEIRTRAIEMSQQLAGLPVNPDAPAAGAPAAGERRLKLWYVRHNSFAALDPIEEALKLVADVEVRPDPPSKREQFANIDGVVVCAPTVDTFGLLWCLADPKPPTSPGGSRVLHILPPGAADSSKRAGASKVNALFYPFPLTALDASLKLFK